MIYIYRLSANFTREEPLFFDCPDFSGQWLEIKNHTITIRKGYAWNGCSPRWSCLDLFTIGTPNGRLKEGQPITYWASCLHDALFQFRGQHGLSRDQVNQLFFEDLVTAGFKHATLYYRAVDLFAPRSGWRSISEEA